MNNIIKDVSTLTTIPEVAIEKLFKKINYCVCEAVKEDVLQENTVTQIDLGFGILYIGYDPKYLDSGIKYRFIPSEDLNKAILQTVHNKLNLLEDVLSTSLVQKFTDIYKELC